MSAPESDAILAASADAASRSMPGNLTERNLLRDEPESTGYPSEKYELWVSRSQFSSGSSPNPMPGSRIMSSGRMPASNAAEVLSLRNALMRSIYPSPMDAGMVRGIPFMCMITTDTPAEAQSSGMPSSRRP